MKTGNSKLFRKLHATRRAGALATHKLATTPVDNKIPPIQNWWKARNVKDTE